MKIVVSLSLLIWSQVLVSADGLSLLYPLGGDKLPGNGVHPVVWTNSGGLSSGLYIDWYDTNGIQIVSDNRIFESVLSAGTNVFSFHMPSNYPGPEMYKYKFHLMGTNSGGTVYETASDFVFVTDTASFSGSLGNTNSWLPGQSRDLSLSWSGFQSNDNYDVILEAPALNKPDYGFLMTNLLMGSEGGTQVVHLPYPTNQSAAYLPALYTLARGSHMFRLLNKRCGISHTFGPLDVMTPGISMSLLSGSKTNVVRGDIAPCARIKLDATLAGTTVAVSDIKLVFTSYSSNYLAIEFFLSNSVQVIASNAVKLNPIVSTQYDTLVDFPVSFSVDQGAVTELTLYCKILPQSGLGTFIWNTQNGATNILAQTTSTYMGGGAVDVLVVDSSGSYMTIDEVTYPKFIYATRQGNVVSYGAVCKPQTPYLLQASLDFTTWSGFYTTNGANGTIQIDVPLQVANHFFRLLETNSTPISMPTGDLLENSLFVLTESISSRIVNRESLDRRVDRNQCRSFWSMKHPEWPPLPANTKNLSTITVNGKVYIDDVNVKD